MNSLAKRVLFKCICYFMLRFFYVIPSTSTVKIIRYIVFSVIYRDCNLFALSLILIQAFYFLFLYSYQMQLGTGFGPGEIFLWVVYLHNLLIVELNFKLRLALLPVITTQVSYVLVILSLVCFYQVPGDISYLFIFLPFLPFLIICGVAALFFTGLFLISFNYLLHILTSVVMPPLFFLDIF